MVKHTLKNISCKHYKILEMFLMIFSMLSVNGSCNLNFNLMLYKFSSKGKTPLI